MSFYLEISSEAATDTSRLLRAKDARFLDLVQEELLRYRRALSPGRVLLFPHLSSYHRLLIHEAAQQSGDLSSFSVGSGNRRRTVVYLANACVDGGESTRLATPQSKSSVQHEQPLSPRSDATPCQMSGDSRHIASRRSQQQQQRSREKKPDAALYVVKHRREQASGASSPSPANAETANDSEAGVVGERDTSGFTAPTGDLVVVSKSGRQSKSDPSQLDDIEMERDGRDLIGSQSADLGDRSAFSAADDECSPVRAPALHIMADSDGSGTRPALQAPGAQPAGGVPTEHADSEAAYSEQPQLAAVPESGGFCDNAHSHLKLDECLAADAAGDRLSATQKDERNRVPASASAAEDGEHSSDRLASSSLRQPASSPVGACSAQKSASNFAEQPMLAIPREPSTSLDSGGIITDARAEPQPSAYLDLSGELLNATTSATVVTPAKRPKKMRGAACDTSGSAPARAKDDQTVLATKPQTTDCDVDSTKPAAAAAAAAVAPGNCESAMNSRKKTSAVTSSPALPKAVSKAKAQPKIDTNAALDAVFSLSTVTVVHQKNPKKSAAVKLEAQPQRSQPGLGSASSSKSKTQPAEGDEECAWDERFDSDGESVDQKTVDEITERVGNVKIQKTVVDYLDFTPKETSLDFEEYGHLIEIFDFPASLKTPDIISMFHSFLDKGFDLKWVDDTHAIGIFASRVAATDALQLKHPMMKTRPIAEASPATRAKVNRTAEFLQPYKTRPETTASAARRLVAGALGVSQSVSKEAREKERQQLREARDKKKQERTQKADAWDGSY